jgi:hypothetical protein
VPSFKNDNPLPRFGEVCGVNEAVVAAANDDDVVVLPHEVRLRYGSIEKMQEAKTKHFTETKSEAQEA